jgi:hypothetical protein
MLPASHCFGEMQRGLQTARRMQTPSSQNLGGRQLAGPHAASTHALPSHSLGGRQFFEVQTGVTPGSTTNFMETVTSPALMTSMRWPAGAVDARSNVTVALCGVALLIRMFETPLPGLTLTCDADTFDRSKKPEELTVSAGEVPALTLFGVMG